MTADGRLQAGLIAVLVAAVSLVSGCAGGRAPTASTGATAGTAAPTASTGATAGTAAPSLAGATPVASLDAGPSPDAQGTVLTEDDLGRTAIVKVGGTITVILHSTYWSPASTSTGAVVAPLAAATVAPASPGTCLPGIGCGTVTSTFIAKAPGDAVLTATRTVCGEARNCKDADKLWTVDVHVTP